jgi:hypothetical protein
MSREYAFDHGPIGRGRVVQNFLKFIELSGLLDQSVDRHFQIFQRQHVAPERVRAFVPE